MVTTLKGRLGMDRACKALTSFFFFPSFFCFCCRSVGKKMPQTAMKLLMVGQLSG
jgi:hypothetical protein